MKTAAFLVPVMTHKWNYFAVVIQRRVTLVDCEEHGRILSEILPGLDLRGPVRNLVGNAGATGLERFTVSSSLADEEAAGHCSKHKLCSYYHFILLSSKRHAC